MRRVTDYAEVKALTSMALRRRAVTNCIPLGDELAREVSLGSLYLDEWEGGALLAKRRGGFDVISLFVFDPTTQIPRLGSDGVCEIVFDPKGKSRAELLEGLLLACGFEPSLRRMRLTSERAADSEAPEHILTFDSAHLTAVSAFLEENFDPRLGCIPSLRVLSEELAAGCFHGISDGAGIASLIHVRGSEINHLATRRDCRGKGYAKALVQFASRNRTGKRMQVWCAEDNSAAKNTYLSCGFIPDGYSSLVLQYRVGVTDETEEKSTLIHI